MIASVYVKDGNIHFYNEQDSHSNTGGIAYELGKPLLDFVCYEPERFDDGFSTIVSAFDNEFAHAGAKDPAFIAAMKELVGEVQQSEIYLYFYAQTLMDFIYAFMDSPRKAVECLAEQIPGAKEKLAWAMEFEWPAPSSPLVQAALYADKEKRLYRAAKDAADLMSADLREKQASIISEIELLISFRQAMKTPTATSLEYLYWIEQYRLENTGCLFYLENPLRTFYAALPSQEIVQLYEVSTLNDLCRFEFIRMIEHDIFIRKCKNCERFFIPRRRADAEYCDRTYGDGPRKCSEVGAMLRYEKKVAENPILEAYSKAYKRFNSRTRAKKMTQSEFLRWSEDARKRRDACMAGEITFEEFIAWLEQGRVRKARNNGKSSTKQPQGGLSAKK